MIINESDLINVIRQVIREELSKVTDKEEFYTINETCAKLKITRPTLYRWVEKGSLKPSRIGGLTRFSGKEIERVYLNNKI